MRGVEEKGVLRHVVESNRLGLAQRAVEGARLDTHALLLLLPFHRIVKDLDPAFLVVKLEDNACLERKGLPSLRLVADEDDALGRLANRDDAVRALPLACRLVHRARKHRRAARCDEVGTRLALAGRVEDAISHRRTKRFVGGEGRPEKERRNVSHLFEHFSRACEHHLSVISTREITAGVDAEQGVRDEGGKVVDDARATDGAMDGAIGANVTRVGHF